MQSSRRSLITGQSQTPAAAAAYAVHAMAPHPKTRLIFDMHSHIEMAPPRRPDGSYDIAVDLAIRDAFLDRLGFTAAVLMTRQLGDRPSGAADTRKQNDYVAWYRDNNRPRYPVALGNIDPINGIAADMAELSRMHEELKLDGVIFHNVFQTIDLDDPRMIALCREMGNRGMPCFVHLNADGMQESSTQLGALATAAPRTTFIGIGALGTMDNIHGMHLVGKLCPNVMFDTTACWQKGRWLARFVKDFGSRRIVFGTDMNASPNAVYHFPQGLLDVLELPELTEMDRQNILWDNAQHLFPQIKALRGTL